MSELLKQAFEAHHSEHKDNPSCQPALAIQLLDPDARDTFKACFRDHLGPERRVYQFNKGLVIFYPTEGSALTAGSGFNAILDDYSGRVITHTPSGSWLEAYETAALSRVVFLYNLSSGLSLKEVFAEADKALSDPVAENAAAIKKRWSDAANCSEEEFVEHLNRFLGANWEGVGNIQERRDYLNSMVKSLKQQTEGLVFAGSSPVKALCLHIMKRRIGVAKNGLSTLTTEDLAQDSLDLDAFEARFPVRGPEARFQACAQQLAVDFPFDRKSARPRFLNQYSEIGKDAFKDHVEFTGKSFDHEMLTIPNLLSPSRITKSLDVHGIYPADQLMHAFVRHFFAWRTGIQCHHMENALRDASHTVDSGSLEDLLNQAFDASMDAVHGH